MTEWGMFDEYDRKPPRNETAGAEETFLRRNSDGSLSVLTISHHVGCRGLHPCQCLPVKTSDRHYPRIAT